MLWIGIRIRQEQDPEPLDLTGSRIFFSGSEPRIGSDLFNIQKTHKFLNLKVWCFGTDPLIYTREGGGGGEGGRGLLIIKPFQDVRGRERG
jgi:hypothetical protein